MFLVSDANGNVKSSVSIALTGGTGGSGITSLNSQTGATQSFVNDTNITITSVANTHSLGWSGTLAAGRLNTNVVQAIINGTNVTGSITAQTLTLGWTGTLANTLGGTAQNSSAWTGIPYVQSGTWAASANLTFDNSVLQNAVTYRNTATVPGGSGNVVPLTVAADPAVPSRVMLLEGTRGAPTTTRTQSTPMLLMAVFDASPNRNYPNTCIWGNPHTMPLLQINGYSQGTAVGNLVPLVTEVRSLTLVTDTDPITGLVDGVITAAAFLSEVNTSAGTGVNRAAFALNPVVSWQGTGPAPPNLTGIEVDVINGVADDPSADGIQFCGYWAQAAAAGRKAGTAFLATGIGSGAAWRNGIWMNSVDRGIFINCTGASGLMELQQNGSPQFVVTQNNNTGGLTPLFVQTSNGYRQIVLGNDNQGATPGYRILFVAS